jgi:hypothetical protein
MPSQMSPSNHMEQHDSSVSRNSDPKKRKRKRLLAVLDKLHNNNTNITAQEQSSNSHSNDNNNSILVNNNIAPTTDDEKASYSADLARSMQENAEILRNLFALSRSLPTHPAFQSPFASIGECNNNLNDSFASSPDNKLSLNGRVKMEVKEEVMDDDEANCSASVRDSSTPLHEYLQQLPKTTFNNQPLSFGHQPQPFYQNGFFGNQQKQHQPQDVPLDLSMKSFTRRQSSSSSSGSPSLTKQLLMQQTEQKLNAVLHPLGIQVPRDCSISLQTTPNSNSSSPNQLPQYYQDLKVSPIVEEVAPGSNNVAYVCPVCGQMFSLNDRLAKHIASRHKTKSPASESTKSYVCEVCDRSFAR